VPSEAPVVVWAITNAGVPPVRAARFAVRVGIGSPARAPDRVRTGLVPGRGPPVTATPAEPRPKTARIADCTAEAIALKAIAAVVQAAPVSGFTPLSVSVPPVGVPETEKVCTSLAAAATWTTSWPLG
jgi:hypothetical protein